MCYNGKSKDENLPPIFVISQSQCRTSFCYRLGLGSCLSIITKKRVNKMDISGLYNFTQWSWYKPRDCWRGEFCFSCWLQTQLFNTDIASSLDYFIKRRRKRGRKSCIKKAGNVGYKNYFECLQKDWLKMLKPSIKHSLRS